MRDYTRKIAFPETALAKIKGHTRIELTKVATGEKKIIEHDNVFQSSVVARQLRALGAANASPWNNSTWASYPLYRNLCGGILLFEDQIDTTGGDVPYMPAGNTMVANGAFAVTNNGTPQELGSFNSIESSFSGTSAVFVYDWGTSQGNGTISCVCLTSETGGFIGYGNPSGVRHDSPINILQNQAATALSDALWLYNGYKYTVTAIDTDNKKLTIRKRRAQTESTTIFGDNDYTDTQYTYTGTISAPGSTFWARMISATKVAIFYGSRGMSLNNGASTGFLVYDCEADTLTVQPITNTTGSSLTFITSANTTTGSISVWGYDATGFYIGNNKFDLTGTFVEAVTEFSGAGDRYAPTLISDGFAIGVDKDAGSTGNLLSAYDFVNKTQYPINASRAWSGLTYPWCLFAMQKDDLLGIRGQDMQNLTPVKNPLYLATVNNLENPVTKDSTQTMKVIYTLTEAS